MPEDFLWVAYYTDGSLLVERQGLGFRDIELERLAALALAPQREGLPAPVLALGPGMRPIFFRRRKLAIDPITEEQTRLPDITVLGWQATVGGHNVKHLCAFYHDGSVKITDDEEAF